MWKLCLLVLAVTMSAAMDDVAEFSPSAFPFATAPFNLEAMQAVVGSKNLVKLPGGGKRNVNSMKGQAAPVLPRCTLELQVVQRLSGVCVDHGRSNACSAGAYIYPFHPECTTNHFRKARSTTGQ